MIAFNKDKVYFREVDTYIIVPKGTTVEKHIDDILVEYVCSKNFNDIPTRELKKLAIKELLSIVRQSKIIYQ